MKGGDIIKEPCKSKWESVYEGFELEIHIVDHCNLNCAGCNHFAPLAEPYFIDFNLFSSQLNMVKQRLPSLKRLMILGGEPCLHPQLKELLIEARNIFPDVQIDVLTNGTLLDTILENSKIYQDNQINFTISRYKNIEYDLNKLDEIVKKGLGTSGVTRPTFMQTLVDINGMQDASVMFNEKCQVKKPCLTLKDYKIFECPFAAHFNVFANCFNIKNPLKQGDFLDLHTVTLEQLEEFCYQPKNICKYCRSGDYWLWHQSDKSFEEYTKSIQELYFSNYEKYLSIINNHDVLLNKFFIDDRDIVFAKDYFIKQQKRFGAGTIDLIIPYYNTPDYCLIKLQQSLLKQKNIEDVVIYLISDGSDKLCEEYVIDLFTHPKLNTVFLKSEINKGPGVARNIGIKNSYNKILYFLDADDYLINDEVFNNIIYDLSGEKPFLKVIKLDGRDSKKNNINKEVGSVYDIAVQRKFIEAYNIFYGEFYCHEDAFFMAQIQLLAPLDNSNMSTPYFGSIYTENNPNRLSQTISAEITPLYFIASQYLLSEKLKTVTYLNRKACATHFLWLLDLEKNLDSYYTYYLNNNKKEEFQLFIVFYYYMLITMYENLNLDTFLQYLDYKYNDNQAFWLEKIKNKDYFFRINDKEKLFSKSDIKNFIKKRLKSDYNQNEKIFQNIYNLLTKEELYND